MAVSDEKGKSEKEEGHDNLERAERMDTNKLNEKLNINDKAKEPLNEKVPPLDNNATLLTEQNQEILNEVSGASEKQFLKQVSVTNEIHLVKHLMRLKANPTVKHLAKFVSRLERVVTTINNLEGVKIMYTESNEMSEKVRNNVKELEFLTLEMKATLNDLQRLKEKRVLIKKEKEFINEKRSNTKREEIHEMESVIGVYDKELLRSWLIAKKSTSVQTVENFITHIRGKKQASEYAFKLATEKLALLKNRQGKQSKAPKNPPIKALPPPSSDSDLDSVISTD